MKILITTEMYLPTVNGVVRSIVTLKKSLEELGHEVKILTLANKKEPSSDKDIITIPSYTIERLYPGARIALFKNADAYHELVNWCPDLIHSQSEFSAFRVAKKLSSDLNIPLIHTYHTIYEDYTHYFSPKQTWGKKLVSLFSKRVLDHTSAVIAPSQKTKEILESYGVTQPILIVPTGIDLDNFQQKVSTEEKTALRNKYQIPLKNDLLVTIGRVAKEKNLDELINFIYQLNRPTLSLLIVGDGPHLDVLKEKVRTLGLTDIIKFTGMIRPDNVYKYYQLGDIFVSGSTSETQGLTYIEALASGLPALCRKDTSIEEVIINGKNGYQYNHFDDFSNYLSEMLENPEHYRSLSQNASQFAYERYSDKQFAQDVENLYEHVSLIKLLHLKTS